jgi:hypothetical protein
VLKGDSVIVWMHLMTTIAWITFGTTIGIVSPWLYRQIKNRPRRSLPTNTTNHPQPVGPAAGTNGQHAAVSLFPCLEACPAAWKMQGERFLSGEEPALPLADCAQTTCDCRYRQHDDRRADENRRDNWGKFGGFEPHYGHDERRTRQDRRTKVRSD